MIYGYINTRENWKNSKLCENTPPCGRRVSTQFLVFPVSTRVDITVYQHGKCFIFLNYQYCYKESRTEPGIISNYTEYNVFSLSIHDSKLCACKLSDYFDTVYACYMLLDSDRSEIMCGGVLFMICTANLISTSVNDLCLLLNVGISLSSKLYNSNKV